MPAQERKELIERIQQKRDGSRLICCLTSDRNNAIGQIAKDFLYRFFGHLRSTPNLEKLDILLFTLGGDTLAAYALSQFVRQFAKRIGVLVPHWCHSGGTLFALGADEIVMTRVATLSAIDPSIVGQLNPFVEIIPGQKQPVPVAVESVVGFKNTVREDWRLNEEGTALAFRLLADKVNPLLIGDLYRSREQIIRLATNLMKRHQKHDEDKIRGIVETLATRLGSHDYLLTPDEARDLMKPQVVPQNPDLEDLVWRLYEDFAKEMELGVPFNPAFDLQMAARAGQTGPLQKTLKIVVIESLDHSDVWEREVVIMPPLGQFQILRDNWR
jgi:Serine dehydrogenase proteinase